MFCKGPKVSFKGLSIRTPLLVLFSDYFVDFSYLYRLIMAELIESERIYVEELQSIMEVQ